MYEPPGRHDITIRIATEAGRHPGAAAFALAANRAAAARNAIILSAHTADEIICVVGVPAASRPEAAGAGYAGSIPVALSIKSHLIDYFRLGIHLPAG
jgi:hypothetical protein